MSERIGLFGGSFDPVHIGHQKIVNSFLENGKIDELWILPSASPPHKKYRKLTKFSIRCEMVDAAFKNRPGVKVVRLEERLPAPNYTLQTLKHLQGEYPDKKFFLCIGSDSLQQITSWYRYKDLLARCKLLVAKRPDYDVTDVPPEASVHFVDHKPVPFSSSEIREKIGGGEPVDELVPPEVFEIIKKYGLYKT
ncbi:MAG: nicotinate (nicotinamide) nucleotide adenylyltransferase [Balneolales bacterium]